MWEIKRYEPSAAPVWDEFVRSSRNGTFLFERAYMDYHSDRFADRSLMAYKNGKLRAVLPANITPDGILHSHQGLTYGGWVLPPSHIDGSDMLELWEVWFGLCRGSGIKAIDYRPMPWIFARQPSQEDIYCLFRCNARLQTVQLSSVIDLGANPGFDAGKTRHLRKAMSCGAIIGESDDTDAFMELLESLLGERYGARPVHSASELRRLKDAFPDNIRLFTAGLDGKLCAGIVIYDTGIVAHTQYVASNREGRDANLVTLLHHHLITDVFAGRRYYDFGTSNEDEGRVLNGSLLRQKATLGATGAAFSRFLIEL